MTEAEATTELRVKHLDYIQQIVTRLAGNSFMIRGWSVTVIAAVLALSKEKSDWRFALLAIVPAIVFWFLDSLYLWQERRFRALHDRVRFASTAQLTANPYFLGPDFVAGEAVFPQDPALPAQGRPHDPGTQWSVAWSLGLCEFHIFLVLIIVFAALYLNA
jgi:hypothetical protein